MTWVQGMLDDEGIFPSQIGTSGLAYFYGVPKRLTLFLVHTVCRRSFPEGLSLDGQVDQPPPLPGLRPPVQPPLCTIMRSQY